MSANSDALLITGATGMLGGRLACAAMKAGHRVRTLSRREWDGPPYVPLRERFLGSLPDGIPRACLAGVGTVVHCAATDRGTPREIEEINATGSLRLAEAAAAAGAARMIYVSSSSARPDAVSPYGKSKFKAERALLGAGNLPMVVIRPNLVVGPDRGVFGRMCRLVDRLPVLPLIGGGGTVLQPVHVDDLCAAILACIMRGPEIEGRTFSIGDPEGTTLKGLLKAIARDRLKKRRIFVSIPLEPIKRTLRIIESAGITLPVTASNLEGLQSADFADTAHDLAELAVRLRPLAQAILPEDVPVERDAPEPIGRPTRILLAGAGRMGLIHATVISRMRGAVLHGLVEKSGAAARFLRGMGIRAKLFGTLQQALKQREAPDALVIATPSNSHLEFAQQAAERGVACLIEKPLAIAPEQLDMYGTLRRRFSHVALGHGYALLNCPHARHWLARLKAGEFGNTRGFIGMSLLGMVLRRSRGWQTDPASSGGGAFIALGSHVLSLLYAAFGRPEGIKAEKARLYSREVEDSMVAHLSYPGFSGTHLTSWSFRGQSRASHTLAVSLDAGTLVITEALGMLARNDGSLELKHQLDFDEGYNLMPDFVGGGYAREITDLIASRVSGAGDPAEFERILEFEKLLFSAYSRARHVSRFSCADLVPGIGIPVPDTAQRRSGPEAVRNVLDLREGPPGIIAGASSARQWAEIQVLPHQIREAEHAGLAWTDLRVTVPDFFGIARAMLSLDFRDLAGHARPAELAGGARAAMGGLTREREVNFWVAARAMLGGALGLLPKRFNGLILLHPYIVNLALALRQPERIGDMLALCRRRAKRARVGLHCGIPDELAAEGWRFEPNLDALSVLSSPGSAGMKKVISRFTGRRVTAEVGPGPAALQIAALERPESWGEGASAILVGAEADREAASLLRRSRARMWERAFPGVSYPDMD